MNENNKLLAAQMQIELKTLLEKGNSRDVRKLLNGPLQEFNHLDFKEEGDLAPEKLARHILAMANSEGGAILFGVTDGGPNTPHEVVGCQGLTDISSLYAQLKTGIGSGLIQRCLIHDFHVEELGYARLGERKIRVITVCPDESKIPYYSISNKMKLDSEKVYVRKGGASVEASHPEIVAIIDRRNAYQKGSVSLKEQSLEEHLVQLKTLYKYATEHLNPTVMPFKHLSVWSGYESPELKASMDRLAQVVGKAVAEAKEKNQKDTAHMAKPEENFNEFVNRALSLKKIKIMLELDI